MNQLPAVFLIFIPYLFFMRSLSLFFLLLVCSGSLLAQPAEKTDTKLTAAVQDLIKGFRGDIGIYIKDLKTGKTVAINADTVFPTASIVKVPILITIMNRIRHGELDYRQHLTWADTMKYEAAEDIAGYLKPGTPIELSKVMMLMMTISDNNASLWLQSVAGTGTVINALMDSLGYKNTRVNSRTPGREAYRSVYGWGQTTPREMASIFERIVNGQLLSKESSAKMLKIMSRQYWDEEALEPIPAGVFTADKNGAVDQSRSEVLYVNARHPYILSIFTKNNQDSSWVHENEAWVLTRKISALLFERFNKK